MTLKAHAFCDCIAGRVPALPSSQHSSTAIMLSSLTGESSRVRRPSLDDDVIILLRALRTMGLEAELVQGDLRIDAQDMGMTAERMEVESSELAFCMVCSLASNIPRRTIIDGSLPQNFPIHPFVNALLNLGVNCDFPRRDWRLPMNVRGPHRSHMTYMPWDSPPMAFLSLALGSLYGVRPTRIEATGRGCRPLLHPKDLDLMRRFGVSMEASRNWIHNPGGQRCHPAEVLVPSDGLLEDFFLCLGIMHGQVDISGIGRPSPAFSCLRQAGLDVHLEDGVLRSRKLETTDAHLDAKDCPASAPFLLVAASSWTGLSRIDVRQDAMTLQEKVALRYSISLLRKMGCDVMENGDSLFVPGSELGVAQLRPSSAESGLTAVLAASRNASAEVLGVEMVTNRYPGITSELKSIGLDLCLNEDDEQVFLLRVD